MISINIAIFGDNNTGKTTLINNFERKKQSSEYETIGIENTSMKYMIEVPICKCIWNKVNYILNFKDVSERHFGFDNLVKYMKEDDITICLIVFDFSNRTSYYNAKKKLKILKKKFKSSYFILVGNKSDLNLKEVSYEEAYLFSETENVYFYQANKNRENILILFTILSQIYFDSFKYKIPALKIIKKKEEGCWLLNYLYSLWKKN